MACRLLIRKRYPYLFFISLIFIGILMKPKEETVIRWKNVSFKTIPQKISAPKKPIGPSNIKTLIVRNANMFGGFDLNNSVFRFLNESFLSHGYRLQVNKSANPDITLLSVFGRPTEDLLSNQTFVILFSGENFDLHAEYKQTFLQNSWRNHAVMSHEPSNGRERVVRVPLWFFYYDFFNENSKDLDFVRNHTSSFKFEERPESLTFISRHAIISGPLRGDIRRNSIRVLEKAGVHVTRPGSYMKNSKSIEALKVSKSEYMKKFFFNLCPENSQSPGYITEKIFQAAFSKCIPIYWGEEFYDIDIFNKKRLILIEDEPGSMEEMADQVKKLLSNKTALMEFWTQPIFSPDAAEKILKYKNAINSIARLALEWLESENRLT